VFTISCLFHSPQIKDETKRPVYCALIRLLQGKDLSVRVCNMVLLTLLLFLRSINIFVLHYLCFDSSNLMQVIFFSWQPVDPCAYMLKMRTFQRGSLLIFFPSVGTHVLSCLRMSKNLIQR
jgi:hypothetical protein